MYTGVWLWAFNNAYSVLRNESLSHLGKRWHHRGAATPITDRVYFAFNAYPFFLCMGFSVRFHNLSLNSSRLSIHYFSLCATAGRLCQMVLREFIKAREMNKRTAERKHFRVHTHTRLSFIWEWESSLWAVMSRSRGEDWKIWACIWLMCPCYLAQGDVE